MESEKVVTLPSKNLFHYDRVTWEKGFQNFIVENYLSLCLGDSDKEDQLKRDLVQSKYMPYWIIGVTDESYDNNISNNYEVPEYYGDEVMSAKLAYFMLKEHPDFTEDQMSNIDKKYLSKEYQSKMSDDIGLPNWFRGFVKVTIDKKEDLFEAMFGMLCLVGNMHIHGLGDTMCQNFITRMFRKIKLEQVKKDAPTRFKELFIHKKWAPLNFVQKKQVREYTDTAGRTTMKIVLTEEAYNEISSKHGIKSRDLISITPLDFKGKKYHTNELFELAVKKLEDWGYSREEELSKKKTIYDISPQVQDKLKQERYEDPEFKPIKNEGDYNYYYQLVARQADTQNIDILAFAYIRSEKKTITPNAFSSQKIFSAVEQIFLETEKEITKEIKGVKYTYNPRLMLQEIRMGEMKI